MDKKRIIIIGANSFQNKLIMRAKERGYETHVFAWKCGDIGERTADVFYPISITEYEKILEVCREINPIGVCSIASDLAVTTVNYVANRLGLVGNSDECSKIATDKYEMRKMFKKNDLPSPRFILYEAGVNFNNKELEELKYPLIVKPADRSGSRGVSCVKSIEGLKVALETATEQSFSGRAIIEEYVSGIEYSVEYISYRGEHHFLAVTRKFTSGYPHFVEIAHYQPAELNTQEIEKIKMTIENALDTLQISNGASHSEIKIDACGNIKIIEIGARMGGGCIGSDLVKISTGYDFVDMVIDVSCGKKPCFEKKSIPKYAFIKFFTSEDDWTKLSMIQREHPEYIHEVTGRSFCGSSKGLISSEDRTGYYILSIESTIEFHRICRFVMGRNIYE